MAVTNFFAGEIATELLKQLVLISTKAWRYQSTAKQLLTLIESKQPTIKQIQYCDLELPSHRIVQIDIHCLLADSFMRFECVDKSLESVIKQVGSMKIRGGWFIRDAIKRAEATTMEIDTSKNFWLGLEMGKRNVKKMLFESEGEIFGIIGKRGVSESHDRSSSSDHIPKLLDYISTERKENTIDKYITCGAYPVRSFSSDAKTNADLLDRTSTNSMMDGKITPPQIQVFINFRGVQLRRNFVGYLVHALNRRGVNVFIDKHEQRGEEMNTLFKRIEDSGIAIVVFSTRYTESKWCLEELVKIKERVQQGLLKVIPIFYKVSPTDVKRLKGEFGNHFRDKEYRYGSDSPLIKAWKEAILFATEKHALVYDENSRELEVDFVETIVKEVLEMLQSISITQSSQSSR